VRKNILFAALFAVSGLIGADYGKTNALDYYKDGVRNTTSLINKHLRDGLQENVLDQYYGRYLVATNLEKLSFVDIIFYENIAEKAQILDVKIVKKISTGESFMVFGAYERKADAEMIQTQLMESDIEANVVKNDESKNGYVSNPLIVKKYLSDIRELIKDMPVKVIKIEKTIAKDGAKCELPLPALANKSMDFSWLQDEFKRIEETWIARGEASSGSNYIAFLRIKGALAGKKNYYFTGEKISCFRLKSIIHNNYAMTDSIYLEGPDGNVYIATRKTPVVKASAPVRKFYTKSRVKPTKIIRSAVKPKCGTKGEDDFCPDETSSTVSLDSAPIGTRQNTSPRCDFSGINLAKVGGKSVKVSSTSYSNKQLDVKVMSTSNGFVSVKTSGMPEIVISQKSFDDRCQK
jgi:hypothetical protein